MNTQLDKTRAETTSAQDAGVVGIITHPYLHSVTEYPSPKRDDSNTKDAALVAAALEDLDKFEKIVERYEAPILRYIQRISSFSREEAEDILQEVFINCWRNLNSYQPDLPFRSWIYRIAHNVTISAFRKHKSRGYDMQIEIDASLYDLLPYDELGIHSEIYKKQKAELVRSVLNMMTIKEREVLVLRYFEDQDYDSISDILRKPIGTISILLHRAKKSFKELWERLNSTHSIS